MSPRFSIRPLSAQPDARLAELAASGEERAFETLARRHRRALVRYCARIGVPEHRIDDVLQQSLTKAWLSLSDGVEVREPRAWLYRIVHNAALNSIRSARLHAHDPLESLPLALVPSTGEEPGLALRARDALGHVAALPEMQREAIVMTAIEGRSHEETAGLLGVSDGAVRGLVHRARTTLRSAAAVLSPHGLLGLLARVGGDAPLAERSAEISAGGAAVGATGLFAKGALVTALAGLLAAGGSIAHLGGGHEHHSHTRTPIPVSASSSVTRGPSSVTASLDGGSRTESRGPAERRGSSHGRLVRHGGHGRGGRDDHGRSREDDQRVVGPVTVEAGQVTADVDRSGAGAPTGREDGLQSGSKGGSGGSAGPGRSGPQSSQVTTEADGTSADAGQLSVEEGSDEGGGTGGGSTSSGQVQTGSGGGSGSGSGKDDTEADGSSRGGPQASRIPG